MKKLVLVNENFKDVYTGIIHTAGDKLEITDERVAEIKGVNPTLVTVIGSVEGESDADKLKAAEAELKKVQEKLKKAEAELKAASK